MFSTILQVILALPRIYEIVKSIYDSWRAMQDRAEKISHEDAMNKLREAKSVEEQEAAFRDIVKHL